MEQPDRLLERVARGERDALLTLHDRLGPMMLAVALRITRDRAVAEEVVQESLLTVWREAAAFDRARGTAASWLLTLVRNRAIDALRARRRRTSLEDRSAGEPLEGSTSPEQHSSEAERAAAVRVALSRLRPELRLALELAYYSGRSHSEIAADLNIPLGTIKTRIATAVKCLREELAHLGVG
ncbi:MAG: sigma-70 family RNA polymerase sigma factor [Polyangiales bacterium]